MLGIESRKVCVIDNAIMKVKIKCGELVVGISVSINELIRFM